MIRDLVPSAMMIVILVGLMAAYLPWFKEHPLVASVLGFILLMGTLGTVVTFWQRLREEREEVDHAEQKRQVYGVWCDMVVGEMRSGESVHEAQLRAWGRILALTLTPKERRALADAFANPERRDEILVRAGLARWLQTGKREEREMVLASLRAAMAGAREDAMRPALDRDRIAHYAPIRHPKTGKMGPVEPFPRSLAVMGAEHVVMKHVRSGACALSDFPHPISAVHAHFVAAYLGWPQPVDALDDMKRLARRLLNREGEREVIDGVATWILEMGVSWERCAGILGIPTTDTLRAREDSGGRSVANSSDITLEGLDS